MTRIRIVLAAVALTVGAAACTPLPSGVGTACQGDRHGIVCR
jgi:hypothetical protein